MILGKKGYTLAAWELVRRPKEKGGLGVINLSVQNDALLLKQLDKLYRKENIQWVKLIWQKHYPDGVPHIRRDRGSFWWKDILRLHIQYREVAYCIPGKGDTVSFWDDLLNGSVNSQKYPHLLNFAKEPRISFQKMRDAEPLLSSFRIPMTRQAYNEFLELQTELLQMHPANSDVNDSWRFIWGNQNCSSSKYYRYQYASLNPP